MASDTVNWTKNPRTRLRFLDWINAHERERSILFRPPSSPTARRSQNTLTKRACAQRAAEYVFGNEDADEDSRRLVKADWVHLGSLIYFYIRNLRKTYQKFNDKIGRAAANMIYEQIDDRALLTRIHKLMADEFPMWARLHVHWRTLPHINHLYRPAPLEKNYEPSAGRSKAKIPLPSRRNKMQMSTTGTIMGRQTLEVGSTGTHPATHPLLSEIIVIEDTPPPEERTVDHDALAIVNESKPILEIRNMSEHNIHGHGNQNSASEMKRLELQIQLKKLELESEEKKREAELRRAQIESDKRLQDERLEVLRRLIAFAVGTESSAAREGNSV